MPLSFIQTARLTTLYCAPSHEWSIANMQNCLVHHLISTKLRCALPKSISVQNYIVNLDLHACCQPQKYYTMHPCPCAPLSMCLTKVPSNTLRTKSVRFVHVPCEPPKNRKNYKCRGRPPLHTDIGPLVYHGAQRRLVVHNAGRWCTT